MTELICYYNADDEQKGGGIRKYFVKNSKTHKYPVPSGCKVKYTNEKLHPQPPAGYEKCDYCFKLPR